jgi:hypothetical protein
LSNRKRKGAFSFPLPLVECPVECQYLTVLLTPKGYTFPERREGKALIVTLNRARELSLDSIMPEQRTNCLILFERVVAWH